MPLTSDQFESHIFKHFTFPLVKTTSKSDSFFYHDHDLSQMSLKITLASNAGCCEDTEFGLKYHNQSFLTTEYHREHVKLSCRS